jgi:eukaryotic-like serine/threonine-protein kinase
MPASWSLPGYELQALLGRGARGEVWRGLQRSTGRVVALRRLPSGSDLEALRRARSLDTPYVVQLLDVVEDGEVTLVLELAEGGSLAALLSRRGALDPGEVVTVAVPLAQALAVVHDRGLVHGGVSPSAVLLTGDGMPLLSGLGTGPPGEDDADDHLDPAVAAGGRLTGASDVWSLAALCHTMLTGRPPLLAHESRTSPAAPTATALLEVLKAALVPDPALRPDAAALADALLEAHAAQPVRFHRAPPAPPEEGRRAATSSSAGPRHAAPPRHGWLGRMRRQARRPPRRLAAAAAGAVLLVAAAAVGVAWGQAEGEALPGPVTGAGAPAVAAGASPVATAQPVPEASPEWGDLLDGLDAERAQAFATADAARLEAVYAPAAPGLAADLVLVGRLAGAGRTARGVRHDVRSVEPLEVDDDRARLRVVDVLAAYDVRDAGGAVAEAVPARAEAAHLVDLARTPQGWRLVQVQRE